MRPVLDVDVNYRNQPPESDAPPVAFCRVRVRHVGGNPDERDRTVSVFNGPTPETKVFAMELGCHV